MSTRERFEDWQVRTLRENYAGSTPAGWADDVIKSTFLQFDQKSGKYRGEMCQAEYAAWLAGHADAQAEIARLRGALGEARRRISEDLLGADSQDRRIIEEIDDAITLALDTK